LIMLAACGDDSGNLNADASGLIGTKPTVVVGALPGNTTQESSLTTVQPNTPIATVTPIIAPTPTQEAVSTLTVTIAPTVQPTFPTRPTPAPYPVTLPTPISFKGKGTVFDRKFHSPILDRDMPYRIYLPPNYVASGKRYPVLYMLHGLSGSYTEWIDYKLFDFADDLINKGTIKPLIIVLPSGDQEYWVDHADDGPQYGLYVANDVVGFVDANYRTLAKRESRAIGGHSMGGHGSLQIALNHPGVFGVAGAHSPTLRTKDQSPEYFGDEAFFEAHDPVSLAKVLPNLNNLKIWVDIGTMDKTWRPRAEELHETLTSRGVVHEWYLFEGDHAGEYWMAHVPDYLKFYTSSMVVS